LQKSPDGKSAEITTVDDTRINVAFPEPFDNDLSGYVEVHGTVKSKSTISCTNFVCFPSSMTEDFGEQNNFFIINLLKNKLLTLFLTKIFFTDTNAYKTMLNMLYAVGNQLEGVFRGD